MKLEETSSFSQLLHWLFTESAVKGWSCVLSTEGGGNPGGGCHDGLVRDDELPSDDDGNKNSSLFYQDPVTFGKMLFFLFSEFGNQQPGGLVH